MIKLDKTMLLAAEWFKYSYDHYADHVEIGNARFTRYMPDDVNKLLKAEKEGWSDEKIAQELEIKQSDVKIYLEQFQKAKKIVAAVNPSEAFSTLSIKLKPKLARNKLCVNKIETWYNY